MLKGSSLLGSLLLVDPGPASGLMQCVTEAVVSDVVPQNRLDMAQLKLCFPRRATTGAAGSQSSSTPDVRLRQVQVFCGSEGMLAVRCRSGR